MKPGTFTQIYIQLVFAVKNRNAVLNKNIRERVFKYMSGIITEMKHKSIIINGVSDHVHILIGLNPSISVSDTVREIKRGSSAFINSENLFAGKFAWQEGYGAFTYSRSQLDNIYKYILNQEKHHQKMSFRQEYIRSSGNLKSNMMIDSCLTFQIMLRRKNGISPTGNLCLIDLSATIV